MTQRFPSKRLPQWCCQSWSILVLVLVAAVLMGHGTRLPAAAQDPMVTNRLGMTFVLIPAGDFMMGSPETEIDRGTSEIQHPVTISQPFYLQTTEVTVAQWRAVMGRRFFLPANGAQAICR